MTSTALALKQSSHLIAAPIGSLDAYVERVSSLPVLSREEEFELAERFRRDNDLEAARTLVLSHLRFVVHVARGYLGYGRNVFDALNNVSRLGTDAKEEKDKTKVDEVKANQKKVVLRISHFLIAGECFDEKKPAVFVERARDPDRHPKTDKEIRGVDAEVCVHGFLWLYLVIGLFVRHPMAVAAAEELAL